METTSGMNAEPVTSDTSMQPRRLRMWPAALALIFLSPLVGEVMSGSTPPLLALLPPALIFLPAMYGAWALLTHEVITRRRLGWGNALLLGAAFGIFQEALVVQTWFIYKVPQAPSHPGGDYGVVAGTSLNWALNLTIFHAVVSVTIPLILIAIFFPRRASVPWLGPKRIILVTLWMLLFCGALAINTASNQFVKDGYFGPPVIPYLLAALVMLLLIVLGVFVRFPRVPAPRPNPAKRAPRLWIVRVICCGYAICFFAFSLVLPATGIPAVAAMALMLLLVASALALVRSWSARAGWNERHLLSVAIGVLLCLTFIWGPFIEFGQGFTGMTLVNLLIVVALLIFDQRLKRRLAHQGALLLEQGRDGALIEVGAK